MKAKRREEPENDEMRAQYDLRGGVRGKYLERFRQGTNLVRIESDLSVLFPDSNAVNQALRLLADVARRDTAIAKVSKTVKLPARRKAR